MARDRTLLRVFWEGGSAETRRRLAELTGLVWTESAADAEVVVRGTSPEPETSDLTPREAEVLSYLADGWSNEEIADRLGIGARTVRYHLDGLYRKLGVGRRTEAVREAITRGYLRL